VFLLSVNFAFAEGQHGFGIFSDSLILLSFVVYTFIGGGITLLIRRSLGLNNSKNWIIKSFGLALLGAIIIYALLDILGDNENFIMPILEILDFI
jgi:hypothetical protein